MKLISYFHIYPERKYLYPKALLLVKTTCHKNVDSYNSPTTLFLFRYKYKKTSFLRMTTILYIDY